MGLAHSAAAQAPGASEPASAAFLQKRVPDELATEGVVLSRRNLGLTIEQLGDKWLVSLVDMTTSRVAASTKIDVLPADREAAVATMTHVVAELAAQVVGHTEPPTPPAPPQAAPAPAPVLPSTVLIDDRVERDRRDVAELKFKRQSIRFGATYELAGDGTTVALVRRRKPYQGDLDQELDPEKFYAEVGRPDLADAYNTRRNIMIGGFVVTGIGYAAGAGLMLNQWSNQKTCSSNLPELEYNQCRDDNLFKPTWPLVAIGIGTVGMFVDFYYYYHPHPVEENEAKSLADGHNQGLRGRLGLPVVSRRPLLRDIKVAPYVDGNRGGLVLAGRF